MARRKVFVNVNKLTEAMNDCGMTATQLTTLMGRGEGFVRKLIKSGESYDLTLRTIERLLNLEEGSLELDTLGVIAKEDEPIPEQVATLDDVVMELKRLTNMIAVLYRATRGVDE